MRAIMILAIAEFRAALRNRWVASAILLLAGLALALALVGSAPVGNKAVSAMTVTAVSLASLGVYLLPLLALLLAHDAVVGDVERGTMLLLLTYPIARWQILLGKFIGHLAVLVCATVLGYGAAAVLLGLSQGVAAADLAVFAGLIGTSILFGAAFLALGYLVSSAVTERATAIGVVIVVWLTSVVLFDLTLLGWLVADSEGAWTPIVLRAALVANPVDAYRLINLTGFADSRMVSGLAGLAEAAPPPAVLLVSLFCWTALPLALAGWVFRRREP
ncbi:MAG: ABC transporter permease [Geminicoccaceae bacterium]